MEEIRKKLQAELDNLEEQMHHSIPQEIQKAREFGDLRENAEYKAALERQSMTSGENQSASPTYQRSRINRSVENSDRFRRLRFDGFALRSRPRRRNHLQIGDERRKRSRQRFDLDGFADRSGVNGQKRRRRSESYNAERFPQFRDQRINNNSRSERQIVLSSKLQKKTWNLELGTQKNVWSKSRTRREKNN